MKTCRICKQEKDISLFYAGHAMCKACRYERYKEYKREYFRSEIGVISGIYNSQKRSSEKRGHPNPVYSKEELTIWLYANDYKALYDDWVSGGHTKDSKPSCDRLDDFYGYSFDNMRLVTWKQNKEHRVNDILSGIGTCGLRCRPLAQCLPCGELVATHVSYSAAQRSVGYQLHYNIRTGAVCRQGYYWRYV
jgi:hypothetical protein